MQMRKNALTKAHSTLDRCRRTVASIEATVAGYDRLLKELEAAVAEDEHRARITDQSHFAYPTFARAARVRMQNVMQSRADFMLHLESARIDLEKAQLDAAAYENHRQPEHAI